MNMMHGSPVNMVNSPSQVASISQPKRGAMLLEYLSPLKPFLDDPALTEICVNRQGEVWTEGREGWTRHEVPALDDNTCRQLPTLIASFNNKAISDKYPILSASLPQGERVQVVIPPACKEIISLTIRKPSMVEKTLEELQSEGSFEGYVQDVTGLRDYETELLSLKATKKIKDFLELAVKKKQNILIVGKTGSGKTTLAKSLIHSIPLEERLITIEDVAELTLDLHPNKVHLFYSREDEGNSKVTSKSALASCLRMKPDRILLAELRGDEAWEYIKSVNTGHPGSISTMHANGAFEAFEQLTALIKDSPSGAHLHADYILHRLRTTIDIILFYSQRKLQEIYYDPEHKRKHMG